LESASTKCKTHISKIYCEIYVEEEEGEEEEEIHYTKGWYCLKSYQCGRVLVSSIPVSIKAAIVSGHTHLVWSLIPVLIAGAIHVY
jgi:hypothetical protein